MNLKTRITLLLSPAILAPLIILGVLDYAQRAEFYQKKTNIELGASLDSTRELFVQRSKVANAAVELLSNSHLVRQYLQTDPEGRRYQVAYRSMVELFNSYQETYPEIYELRIIFSDGYEDVRYTGAFIPNRLENVAQLDWFQRLTAVSDEHFEEIVFAEDTGRYDLLVSKRLQRNGRTVYIVASVDLGDIWSVVREERIGRNGSLLVVNYRGNDIFAEDAGQSLQIPADRLVELTAHKVAQQVDFSAEPLFMKAHRLTQHHFLVAHWTTAEVNELMRDRAAEWLILICMVGLLLTAFVVWLINRLIILPVDHLRDVARKIGEGKLEIQSEVYRKDEIGQLAESLNLMSANLAEAHYQLQQMAYQDKLTGLSNRRMFLESLRREIQKAQRRESKMALLFIDLDGFKSVNDTSGHEAGDAVIREVADRLRRSLRDADVIGRENMNPSFVDQPVSRLGGDEFTILLGDIDTPEAAALVAERVRLAVGASYEYRRSVFHISCSIGIAVYPDDGEDPSELLMHADAAMYFAKQGGKNRYAYFDAQLSQSALAAHQLKQDLFRAFEQDEFHLVYQPQYDLASGSLKGVEALMRWFPPGGTPVPPDVFIPLAEESGLIIELSRWVLREACRQSRAWRDAGYDTPKIAINASPHEFARVDMASVFATTMAEFNLNAGAIGIEITETAMMDASTEVYDTLQAIRELGVSIALDDFGTGYSSLAMLIRLPIDNVKIDKSFIDEVLESDSGKGIVMAIIAMARELGLSVTAEGVEVVEQRDFLRDNDCDYVQGYLYSRPLEVDDMCKLLMELSPSAQVRGKA